jgi:putative peptide zinc metalloprotease protein
MARASERLQRLELRAQTAGVLVMPRQGDWAGAYVRQGQALAHVLEPGDIRVRAAVAQTDAHLVRHGVRGVQVRLTEEAFASHHAQLALDTPAATRQLPSAALTDVGGGPYASDPDVKEGTQAQEPVFLFDLKLDQVTQVRVGARAWVRFDHGYEPLALQGYRRASQLFLQHFAPTV